MENILISLSRCQGATESEPGRHTHTHTHTRHMQAKHPPPTFVPVLCFLKLHLSPHRIAWNEWCKARLKFDKGCRKEVGRYWNMKASLTTTDFFLWLAKFLMSLCKHPLLPLPLSSLLRATISELSYRWWAKSVPEFKWIAINTPSRKE